MFQGFVFNLNDVYGQDLSAVSPPVLNNSHTTEQTDDAAVFSSDEFRMYGFKIERCPKVRPHDWMECPYAHSGEKAKRRDPRQFKYSAVSCQAFRLGSCPKGLFCEFAHGVFEYWLHPDRYRTRACNNGRFCQRKVCFFAHSLEELRLDTKLKGRFIANRPPRTVVADFDETVTLEKTPASGNGWGINEGSFEPDGSDSELPDIEWISELLK